MKVSSVLSDGVYSKIMRGYCGDGGIPGYALLEKNGKKRG